MYNPPIVPDDFEVPQDLRSERMYLRPLTIDLAVKDYDAVTLGLTLEQNIIELGWHQTEFQLRTSFAYSVLSPDQSEVMGCMYIYPTRKPGYDVEISMWVRQSRVDEGLDQQLFETVESWIAQRWPFTSPAYPGRRIAFDQWRALPDG
jgi:hypothetical protein